MTDAQILAEFCDRHRAQGAGNAQSIRDAIAREDWLMAEIARTGGDEG